MTSDELRVSISKWTELSDTVFNFIEKDPAFTAHTHLANTYMLIHDSIQFDLFRLAVAKQRTLKDVFRIKKEASIYNKMNDLREQVATAERFYESLDTIKIPKFEPMQNFYFPRSGVSPDSILFISFLTFFIILCVVTR